MEVSHQLAGSEIQQKWQGQESEAGVRAGGGAEKLQESQAERVHKQSWCTYPLLLGEHPTVFDTKQVLNNSY